MNNGRNSVAEDDVQHDDETVTDPSEDSGPDDGPTMSGTGAMPGGSEMAHWDTSQMQADASNPGSMPHTTSRPMPGEKNHAARNSV